MSGLTGSVQSPHTAIKIPDVIQYLHSETLSFLIRMVFPILEGKSGLIQHWVGLLRLIKRVIIYEGRLVWTNSLT